MNTTRVLNQPLFSMLYYHVDFSELDIQRAANFVNPDFGGMIFQVFNGVKFVAVDKGWTRFPFLLICLNLGGEQHYFSYSTLYRWFEPLEVISTINVAPKYIRLFSMAYNYWWHMDRGSSKNQTELVIQQSSQKPIRQTHHNQKIFEDHFGVKYDHQLAISQTRIKAQLDKVRLRSS